MSLEDYQKEEKLPIRVILENVRSLSNVGSVFRTCDAFKVDRLILTGITGKPPHREIQRTALGAAESVSWAHVDALDESITEAKAEGYSVYAIEQSTDSIPLHELTFSGKGLCLIFGNEVDGVSQDTIDKCDGVVEIPQSGTKHSLNVSVAAGAVLWEVYKSFL